MATASRPKLMTAEEFEEPIFCREGEVREVFPALRGFRCSVADFFPPASPQ
jgi:hypothetical protein